MVDRALPDVLRRGDAALPLGLTVLLHGAEDAVTGMTLGVYRLAAGERIGVDTAGLETALVALRGRGALVLNEQRQSFDRTSFIDQSPAALHACAGASVTIATETEAEVILVQTANPASFPVRTFAPEDVRTEHRGKGKLGDSAYRLVRTVFDRDSAPEAARLVIGEVLSYPGRWSSYPPHHHAQPELYYYRFDPPQGYGHAELGEAVYKVHEHDVLRIAGGNDHAQAAAPGYHMYYLWAVRHLPGRPYTGFEYTATHRWTFDD